MHAQISVRCLPPAGLIESSGRMTFTAHVSGALPGETTAVNWSLNDQSLTNTNSIAVGPADGAVVAPSILKATSAFDASKFAAVPLISLRKSDLAQIRLPDAIAYHPSTGFVYVAALAGNGTNVDTTILQVAPDGTVNTVTTYSKAWVDKLVPYISNGTPYLLAVDFLNNSVSALDLNTKNSKRIVGGLLGPFSAALHPITGDLYVAEQNGRQASPPRTISVVSHSDLDSALGGTSTAPIRGLSTIIPNISGVSFLMDPGAKAVSLLASASNGALYQINLGDNSFSTVASGLRQAEQVMVLQSAQLGLSFVLVGSSTNVDDQGQVMVTLPLGADQPFQPAYALGGGLDIVTDLAFVPPGTPYSTTGKWVILAASSSPTADRGKIVRWEPDPAVPFDFHAFGDRIQPSLTLISPAPGETLSPGSPVEIRWSYKDNNPLNSASSPAAASTQLLVSADGGNTFTPAGPRYIPSGPQGKQYSQIWQVPANYAGQTIRLALQTTGVDGASIQATGAWDLNVLDKPAALPKAIVLDPDFAMAGQNATITIDGLNFQAGTTLDFGDGVSVSEVKQISNSRLQAQLQTTALTSSGPRSVHVCNPVACQQTQDAFFVLSPNGPRITAIAPQSGSPGTTVLITGNNFSGVAANNLVAFGNLTAVVSRATATTLTVQVPMGLNRGELAVSVQTNGILSNSAIFFLVPSGVTAPFTRSDGVVNGASFSPGSSPDAPGSIISLFGANMTSSIASALSLPLPTQLLNTTVMIGGIPAPLFFAAPDQINAQVPEEITGLSSVPVSILSGGVAGNTVMLSVAPQSPGIFSLASNGKGPGAVLNQDGSLNSPANPEHIGKTLQVYATGLGAANPPVDTGAAAPAGPLSISLAPQATIDGLPASVTFAGRSPGFVGLDQVNVTVPAGVSTGRPVPLILTAGGNVSNSVTVNVAP